MYGICCEGYTRPACEPCESVKTDDLHVVVVDCAGLVYEKLLCDGCANKLLRGPRLAWAE